MTADGRTIYVVRHAHAVARERWDDDDSRRTLSPLGANQSDELGKRLAEVGVDAIYSSGAVRCVATLEPLARMIGKQIVQIEALAEGSSATDALGELLRLVDGLRSIVACTHGDVVEGMLDVLNAGGTNFHSRRASPKAGTWTLTVAAGAVTDARLVRAPEL